MNNYKCPFAEHKKEGFKVWLKCNIQNDICPFIRYCPTKKDVEHSERAPQCQRFLNNKDKVGK